MTITRDEILAELRELLTGAWGLSVRHSGLGVKALTPGDWAAFHQSVERAAEFVKEVDGPKIETGCICSGNVQGESLMGRKCKLHSPENRKG